MATAVLVASVLAAVAFARHATGDQGTIRALRLTARWSFLLFWLAYVGGAMARLFGPRFTGLARHGRELGPAFASAQLIHVGLVLWFIYFEPGSGGGMVFFWVGILCVYLLALFSFAPLRNALGTRLWQTFRTAALEYIALGFATDFILLPLNRLGNYPLKGLLDYPLSNVPFVVMLVVGTGLRVASFARYSYVNHAQEMQMSKPIAIAQATALLLFASIGIGLSDLFHGLNTLAATVASIFVVAGTFNTWRSLNSN
jgi:hypothetical protein